MVLDSKHHDHPSIQQSPFADPRGSASAYNHFTQTNGQLHGMTRKEFAAQYDTLVPQEQREVCDKS